MQFSQKQRTFPQFLAAFLKSNLNLAENDDTHRFCIFKISESQNVVR